MALMRASDDFPVATSLVKNSVMRSGLAAEGARSRAACPAPIALVQIATETATIAIRPARCGNAT